MFDFKLSQNKYFVKLTLDITFKSPIIKISVVYYILFAKSPHPAFGHSGGFILNMIIKQKIAIYIDGSNLYFKLKNLKIPNISQFNYQGLCEHLADKREIISCNYYVGVIKAKSNDIKGQHMREGQLRLFNNLKEQNIILHKGYLMENDGVYHEKGVDVNIAVDLLVGAYENTYDAALLISSDTDLIPAIKKVKSLGKKLEYIGFMHSPSRALQKQSSRYKLLIKNEIETFLKT